MAECRNNGKEEQENTAHKINLIDATKKSAWAALATGIFDKAEQLESKINKAAADIFKKFPAGRSKGK